MRRTERRIIIKLNGRFSIRRRRHGFPAGQHIVGLLDALPTVVAIHRPEPATDRRDFANPDFPTFRVHLFDVANATFGRCVATISKRVNKNLRDAIFLGLLQNAINMIEHAMNAGIAHNPHEMEFGSARFHSLHHRLPDRVGGELLFRKQFVQSHQFLVHDPPGPDILVPHFAVTHHPVRQPDIEAARSDQSMRRGRMQPIIARFVGEMHGVERVLLGMGIFSPTITDNEEDGCARGAHQKLRRLCMTGRRTVRRQNSFCPRMLPLQFLLLCDDLGSNTAIGNMP